MGANKNANLQKCGEILIDIKTKNRKNKMYIFHCTFCNIECDQLKKFSLHIGEEHLDNFEDILKETELKFEAEPEEIKIQTLTPIQKSDIKIIESCKESGAYVNADPLDTVNPVSPISHNEFLSCEIKSEFIENSEDESAVSDKEEMVCSPPIVGSDKQTNEDSEFINISSEDKRFEIDSDSEDEMKDDLDEMPLKKRKLSGAKKAKKINVKANTNDMDSDDSKDAEYNDPHDWEIDHELLPNSTKNIRQNLKNSGKAYKTLSGKLISERKVRDLEYCKKRCKEKICKEQQEFIFNTYWNLGSYYHRQIFIASLIDVEGTQSQCKNKSLTNPRTRIHTYRYYLELPGQTISVCQKCFLYTLCETRQFIRTTMKKKIEGTIEDIYGRSKHPNMII